MILHELNEVPKATVRISHWHAKCAHDTVLGYGDLDIKGCGIEWKYVMADYIGEDDLVQSCRPDLELIELQWEPAK